MGHVDFFYWRLAALCFVLGILFFFLTTDSLVKGKLRLPAWVFSSFTLVMGIYFFTIFVKSANEFMIGRHEALDELIDTWEMISRFFGFLG